MIPSLQPFFHHRVIEAFEMLSDPEKTMELPLAQGRAAGNFSMERATYRPEGVHANDSTADFTFVRAGFPYFKLRLMVNLVYLEDGGNDVVLGFISHNQWDEFPKDLRERVEVQNRFVLVRYSINKKDFGNVFMSKELYELIWNTKHCD